MKMGNIDSRYNKNRNNRISKIQRRKARQKKMIIRFIAVFVILMTVSMSLMTVRSYATQTSDTKFVKNYKSIMVEKGDTLESIANLYMSIEFKTKENYIKEVKFINHLDSDTIHAGNYIIVPYYSAS